MYKPLTKISLPQREPQRTRRRFAANSKRLIKNIPCKISYDWYALGLLIPPNDSFGPYLRIVMIPPVVTYHPATATADQRLSFTQLPCKLDYHPEEGNTPACYTFHLHAGAKAAFFAKCLLSPEPALSRITEKAAKFLDIDFVPNQPRINDVTITPYFTCEGKQYAFSQAGYVTAQELPHGAHMQLGRAFMNEYQMIIDHDHNLRFRQPKESDPGARRFHDTYVFSEQDIRNRINFCFSERQKMLKQAPQG